MKKQVQKKIRALFGLDKMPDTEVTPLLEGSLKGLMANATIYLKPPIDLTTYQNAITAYEASITAALDGGKTAIAHKNKLRQVALKMYAELAHYVEANSNEDLATFLLSGFQPASTTKTPPQALPQPAISAVKQGDLTGQLKVKPATLKKALNYILRYAPAPAGGGTPATWTEQTLTSSKPVVINGLTPGTTYTFQIRALGRLGYTDWSDSVNRMVI